MTEVITNTTNYLARGPNVAPLDENRKIFVGGLSWDTTEEDLIQCFSQFGPIENVNIKYNAITGHPRGFGFITFVDDGSIDAVLESGPQSIKNKLIDPRKAKTRGSTKKIFVGGLDCNLTRDDIIHYFNRFGSVENVELPFDRSKGRRRQFCFVLFDNEQSADAACQESKQTIGGRECDIKKALPQNQHQPRNQRIGGPVRAYQQPMKQDRYGTGFEWTQRTDYDNSMHAGGSWRSNGDRNQSPRNGFTNGANGPRIQKTRAYHATAMCSSYIPLDTY